MTSTADLIAMFTDRPVAFMSETDSKRKLTWNLSPKQMSWFRSVAEREGTWQSIGYAQTIVSNETLEAIALVTKNGSGGQITIVEQCKAS
jgi:hypothetical protein